MPPTFNGIYFKVGNIIWAEMLRNLATEYYFHYLNGVNLPRPAPFWF